MMKQRYRWLTVIGIVLLLAVGLVIANLPFQHHSQPPAQMELAVPPADSPPTVAQPPLPKSAPEVAAPNTTRADPSAPAEPVKGEIKYIPPQQQNPATANDVEKYSYSIQQQKQGWQVTPDINVEKNQVNIQLKPDPNQRVIIQRNPADSNNQYQVLWQNKY